MRIASDLTRLFNCKALVSVDGLQEPKAQVAGAAHTLSVCKRHLAHKLLPLQHSTLHHHN
jgi:hypothetical protein